MAETATPQIYELDPPGEPFPAWSLTARLASLAEQTPHAPFLTWGDTGGSTATYAQFAVAVEQVAGVLAAHGVGAGSRVALLMRNSLQHVVCWFACNALGAVDAPINPAYQGASLRQQITRLAPAAVVCDAEFQTKLDPSSLDDAVLIVNRLGADDAGMLLPDLGIDPAASAPVRLTGNDPASIASIYFTSGTTGEPKGVRVPHAQAYFYSYQTAALHRMTDKDTYVAPYPLFHASGRIHGVGSALASGGACVLYDKFSASRFVERMRESGGTITHFLGSMMSLILARPEDERDAALPLRSVMALPCPPNVAARFRSRFGVENIAEVIGMTELSWPVMSPYGVPRPAGAAGLPVGDWYDIEVADPETDLPRRAGEVGELLVRARHPWIASDGYENNDAATVESRRNLWFHTGDLVRRDADGWIAYVDRLKDSIRRRGENISSVQVEEVLVAHPSVEAVAVIGRQTPTEEHDEDVYAFVIWADGVQPDYAMLHAHARAQLPAFSLPDYYVTTPSLPLTPSGKVRKVVLREARADETLVPAPR